MARRRVYGIIIQQLETSMHLKLCSLILIMLCLATAASGDATLERQKEIAQKLHDAGGWVSGSTETPNSIVEVRLGSAKQATDADVALLKEIPTIKVVELPEAATDASLAALKDLPAL